MDRPRYAVYFVPPDGSPLADFGTAVLGYDAGRGADIPFHGGLAGLDGWPELVREPQRYGFHATLRAPFALSATGDEMALIEALRTIARQLAPVTFQRLTVKALHRFVALVPTETPAALADLEARLVLDLGPLRAPMTPAERQRRLAAPLTQRQIEHLDRHGYPYVLDEFRFHMTLAGPVPPDRMADVAATLARLQAPLDAPVRVDEIAILVQPTRNDRFRVLARIALGG